MLLSYRYALSWEATVLSIVLDILDRKDIGRYFIREDLSRLDYLIIGFICDIFM